MDILDHAASLDEKDIGMPLEQKEEYGREVFTAINKLKSRLPTDTDSNVRWNLLDDDKQTQLTVEKPNGEKISFIRPNKQDVMTWGCLVRNSDGVKAIITSSPLQEIRGYMATKDDDVIDYRAITPNEIESFIRRIDEF